MLRVASFLALAIAVGAATQEDPETGEPRMVMSIKLPGFSLVEGESAGAIPELPLFPMQTLAHAFSSAPSLLDDFGHESLFDEIFPESHRKVEIFPAFRRIDNDQGFGGLIGGLLNSVMSGAFRRAGMHHRPRAIELSSPMDDLERREQKQGHCCCKDMHKHCAHVKHDGTIQGVFAVTQCLARRQKEHHDVEKFCAAKVAQTVAGACLDDIRAFCPGLKPGHSKIHSCLYRHGAKLSLTCKKYMHMTTKQLPAASTTTTPSPLAVEATRRAEAERSRAAAALAAAETMRAKEVQREALPSATRVRSKDLAAAAPSQPSPFTASFSRPRETAAPKLSKSVFITLGCIGALLVAAVAALVISRSRRASPSAPVDNSAYKAMLI